MYNFKKNISGLIANRYFRYALLGVLFFLNILWFSNLSSHTLMGDDLVVWNYYHETPHLVDSVIINHDFGKYRPIFNISEFTLFKLFSSSMQAFFWFNTLFNFIIILLLFSLIKKITKNNILAFSFSLLYLTSRFSYYNILQVTGFLEALSMLWLVLMMYAALSYFIEKKKSWLYWLLLFNFFIVFTHERFIVLLPFIIAVIYFGPNAFKSMKQKWYAYLLAIFPLLLNVFSKKVIFDINFLKGTAGTAIKINFLTVFNFIKDGLLNIAGFNIGPAYLSGMPFAELDIYLKLFSYLIISIIAYVFLISIIKWKNSEKIVLISEFKNLFIWLLLFCPLLLAASITIRQEFRWLYAPYLVFIIYLAYLISKNFQNKKKYLLVFLFIFFNLYNNIGYRKYFDNVFFIYSQKISDSFYNESIKKYGYKDRNFIVEKFSAYDWIIPSNLFLKPYVGNNDVIKYVDNLKDIDLGNMDKDKTSVYKLNWPERRMEEVYLY